MDSICWRQVLLVSKLSDSNWRGSLIPNTAYFFRRQLLAYGLTLSRFKFETEAWSPKANTFEYTEFEYTEF